MGGRPNDLAGRYKLAAPIENLPSSAKDYLIASVVLTSEAAAHFQAVAKSKGQSVDILNVSNGGHFDIIAPGSKA